MQWQNSDKRGVQRHHGSDPADMPNVPRTWGLAKAGWAAALEMGGPVWRGRSETQMREVPLFKGETQLNNWGFGSVTITRPQIYGRKSPVIRLGPYQKLRKSG